MSHPAYDLVDNALKRIAKAASGRKHAKLQAECKEFLDNLDQILRSKNPAAAPAQQAAAGAAAAGASDAASGVATPLLGTALGQLSFTSDGADGEAAAAYHAAAAQNEGGSRLAEALTADISEAAPTPTATKADAALFLPTPAATPRASAMAQAAAAPAASSAAAGVPRDLVPRTDAALSDYCTSRLMSILRLAIDTTKPSVVEQALDLLQRLIAHHFLQGAAFAISVDRAGADGGERKGGGGAGMDGDDVKGAAGADPAATTPQAVAVELMCRCDEIADEGTELQVLKCLLTATTSNTFTVHGQALLLAVRTCYNIFLMSRSEVNQTTARASLTQMLNVVFQRMEADAVVVQVRPIVVSDVLGMPKAGAQDNSSLTAAVQTFLNTVVVTAGTYLPSAPTEAHIRDSVAGAFDARTNSVSGAPPPAAAVAAAVAAGSGGGSESEDEKEQFRLGTSASGDAAAAPPAEASLVPGKRPSTAAAGGGTAGKAPGTGAAAGHEHASVLQKDAFLVFRALCKLSIRSNDSAALVDPTAVRGKVLAMELLKVLLENSGPTFRGSDKFISAIRQYLCLSLLKNSASTIPQALQLTCSILLSLLFKFRQSLKAEVGVFLPMILLKALEPPAAPGQAGAAAAAHSGLTATGFAYRSVVLRCIGEMSQDGQLLVDLFVNYDCDLDSSNLFERMFNGLVKLAQTQPAPQNILTASQEQVQQEATIRNEALRCLTNIIVSMDTWHQARSAPGVDGGAASGDDTGPDGAAGEERQSVMGHAASMRRESAAPGSSTLPGLTSAPSALEDAGGVDVTNKRLYKLKFQEGLALFNKKPKKGIEFLQRVGMVGTTPEDISGFLARTEGLNKTTVGDYLGERDDMCIKVMHAYVDAMAFEGLEFDAAIRAFLQGFRLPGEAQKIDRLMEKFAERYVKCNSGSFKSADVAYVLAYSVIMLNTDAHNPQVKKKMTRDDFLKNNRGINDGADLDPDFMTSLYDRIVSNEIKMKDDSAMMTASDAAKAEAERASQGFMTAMNALWSIIGGSRQQVSAGPSDASIQGTLDSLHAKAKGATFYVAMEPDTVRPMLDVLWAPLMGCLSVLFDEFSDVELLLLCLSGFSAGAALTSRLGVTNLRDIFMNSLCNFTHLHSPATMKYKNALAFKALLRLADSVGDYLGTRWVDVLRCISRWELLQQIASGMPTDAVLFKAAQRQQAVLPPGQGHGQAHEKGLKAAAAALQRKLGGREVHDSFRSVTPSGDSWSLDSLAMSEAGLKTRGPGGGAAGGPDSGRSDAASIPQEVINSVDSSELNRVFVHSPALGSESIVQFVQALAAISLDELRDAKAPRVFSLTKIVEIAHFNMTRIRIVWTRIWSVLSEYFISVGCHANLAIAMYAVDSLRQLAMKFLERDELANYTFQNDFLRPFVVVIRQSQAVEIRELIIRCLSQMVLARVSNVKSGWKSMFMVFTTAAGDRDPNIVRLAFDTIEKIVREHFMHITETESTTFTDCVNCLIAFTNNPHSLDVALNSIAFLRFCAMKLADGAIGDAQGSSNGSGGGDSPAATAHVEQGLSKGRQATEPPFAVQRFASPATLASGGSPRIEAVGSGGVSVSSTGPRAADRDDHVYFWFPLLAGLSELTFDPRPEIRSSALEVLFDTLRFHGASFSPAFWARIFDSVLMPIFDHVRAEVTDTTTFTSERRRAQEDAWLYETCTKCLQHLVDLFVQFYPVVIGLWPRMMDLLKGFMLRTHQSLASVGVAGFVRLLCTAGPIMQEEAWTEVLAAMVDVAVTTRADAYELVTPPNRQSHDSAPSAAAAAAAAATASPHVPPATPSSARSSYTLREGVGARRLHKFRSKAAVQLLLVQACSEMYAHQYAHMPPAALEQLLTALHGVADHARRVDVDLDLRRRLAVQQAEDRVPEDRNVPDPPMLRLESEASHAYLSVLMHASTVAAAAPASPGEDPSRAAARAQQQIKVQARLVELCRAILERFLFGSHQQQPADPTSLRTQRASVTTTAATSGKTPSTTYANPCASKPPANSPTASVAPSTSAESRTPSVIPRTAAGAPVAMAAPLVEYTSFAPLVSSTLKALCAFSDATFRDHLPDFFPMLTLLIKCDYAPLEVQRALSEVFLTRVGPLLDAAASAHMLH